MIGIIRDNTSMVSIEDNSHLFDNRVLVLESRYGFTKTDSVISLYSTMTNMLLNINLNSELLNKFLTLNHYMKLIEGLKLDNLNKFIDNIEDYYKKHSDIEQLWDDVKFDNSNCFEYKIYDIEVLDKPDYSHIYRDMKENSSLYSNKIYGLKREGSFSTIMSDDLYQKHSMHKYAFLDKKYEDSNRNIVESVKLFLERINKIEPKYDSDFREYEMTLHGLNIEHVNALNSLMRAYNYLLNSKSFADNEMFYFDERKADFALEMSKCMVDRVPELIQHRIETKQRYSKKEA